MESKSKYFHRYNNLNKTSFYYFTRQYFHGELLFPAFQTLPRTIVSGTKEQMAEKGDETSYIQRSHIHRETHAGVID